jgi:predicted membrane protein
MNSDNNPSIKVNFGAISRSLKSDCLETVQLYCNFGALEVYFDKVMLNPNGAIANLNCSFGAIKLYIPKNWLIIDQLNCSLGGIDIDKNFTPQSENAPKITLTGSVSLGGIEVRYI